MQQSPRDTTSSSLLQGEPNVDYIHPGVGPVLNDDGEDEDKIYHAYYQWVPHYLLLLALLFYAPHCIWKVG